jgi:hypothetical protein
MIARAELAQTHVTWSAIMPRTHSRESPLFEPNFRVARHSAGSSVMSTNQTCGLCICELAPEGFRSRTRFCEPVLRKDCQSLTRRTTHISRRP